MGVRSTGMKQQAIQHHNAPLPDQVPGAHLWVMVSMYLVKPRPGMEVHMDSESLMTVHGPSCLWCQHLWSPELERHLCRGED